MKAKEFLKWFIENQVENTELDYIEIPDGDDLQSQEEFFEFFFGDENVKRHIPGGEYVYIWRNENNCEALAKIHDKSEIIVYNENDPIYLFRIED